MRGTSDITKTCDAGNRDMNIEDLPGIKNPAKQATMRGCISKRYMGIGNKSHSSGWIQVAGNGGRLSLLFDGEG